jgi:hypothetical protein
MEQFESSLSEARRGSASRTKDIGWRLYHSREDNGWKFGALDHLGLANPAENIVGPTIVPSW